ncbi:MAG: site-specific integrase [Chitinophagaceae bacterium]|nr:site-specific integrase [Chitinophagaceae bacterium]
MSVAIAIILDTRRIKENKKYPVKLRVNYQRVTNYYPTIFDLSEEDYQKLSATRISQELQTVRDKLKQIERGALNALEKLKPFSFQAFEKSFVLGNPLFKQRKIKALAVEVHSEDGFDYSPYQKKFPILEETNAKPLTLTWAYLQYIWKLVREGRISSAVAYHCSYVSLKRFKSNVSLIDITPSFLHAYEQFARTGGISKTTIGIYLRPLRAVFNDVIDKGLLSKETAYPFGRRKYQIPTAKKVKKALDLEDVERIYNYQCSKENSSEQMAKDFWFFSYFGNGMNPKDIAFLKYSNIHDDYLTFERIKTERSLRSDPVIITVYINEDMKTIIERWGNKDRSPDNYIFPILQPGLSDLRIYDRIQNFVGLINYWMKEILLNLGIDKKATTYVARHTFSTVLKRSGASTEFIQEALGYTDIKTTENYLDSFDRETKKELATRLTSFKK